MAERKTKVSEGGGSGPHGKTKDGGGSRPHSKPKADGGAAPQSKVQARVDRAAQDTDIEALRRGHRPIPPQPLPATLRAKLELCATEARHRGQYGPMVQALRELRALDEREADERRRGRVEVESALDELKAKE